MNPDILRAPRPAPRRAALAAGLRAARGGVALALAIAARATAGEAPAAAPDPALEAHVQAFTRDLRCLVCQNESLADSRAPLARDLRDEVRRLFQAGQDDAQVRQFLVSRYGDYVLYRPPLKTRTALLWIGPGVLLAGAMGGLLWRLRRHARTPEPPLPAPQAQAARALLADLSEDAGPSAAGGERAP
ncbi:cytochrome c-type biogenesis protein [Achromobacter xylosoxidans]|uniref:cytochrome c-type biogenesis protein n=9 Tax=Alcaligenes xylosoxydans xylosoxydans TaxID=85698 RepID=UPI0009F284BC|nr:cytochrome c-type biogenesis protein [Achromobacter xylosoxidans]